MNYLSLIKRFDCIYRKLAILNLSGFIWPRSYRRQVTLMVICEIFLLVFTHDNKPNTDIICLLMCIHTTDLILIEILSLICLARNKTFYRISDVTFDGKLLKKKSISAKQIEDSTFWLVLLVMTNDRGEFIEW